MCLNEARFSMCVALRFLRYMGHHKDKDSANNDRI